MEGEIVILRNSLLKSGMGHLKSFSFQMLEYVNEYQVKVSVASHHGFIRSFQDLGNVVKVKYEKNELVGSEYIFNRTSLV